jgi:hypothetical protein
MTKNDKAATDSDRYPGEIKLAESAFHLLMERTARGRMPGDAFPTGDVYDVLDTVGELLHLEALDAKGKKVTKKKLETALDRLRSALERLAAWPAGPRVLVIAPLAEAIEKAELNWIGEELLAALPEPDALSAKERKATVDAYRRLAPVRTRFMIEIGVWDPKLEGQLRLLRDLSADQPEDEDLLEILKRGIVLNALSGREHLLLEERRRLADAEPLPKKMAEALGEISEELIDFEIARLGLHLVLADIVAADLVPEKVSERQIVAGAYLAMLRRDDPSRKPDLHKIAGWAKINHRKLDVFSDEMAAVFKWKPPDHKGSIQAREEKRWRVDSLTLQHMPVRWSQSGDAKRSPYSTRAARKRLKELRDVAWMMIDWFEPVRFVSEAFSYGDGAPDEMDIEIVREIINLWEKQAPVRGLGDLDQSYLDDDWVDEDWEDDTEDLGGALPTIVTTDGEPWVFSTITFDVAKGERGEVVKCLDSVDELSREQEDGGERWVWLDPRPDGNVVIASLALEAEVLTVEAQSVARSARVSARLADLIGDRIILKDIHTEHPTPELLADRAAEQLGVADGPDIPRDDQKRIVLEVLDRHYRAWPDQPVPDLGDITPREAVTDPVRRAEVIALLHEFEETTRAATWPMNEFDFGFLWDELGLKRD